MGRKHTRSRKYLYFCIALLTVALVSGCTLLAEMRQTGDIRDGMEQAAALYARGELPAARSLYEKTAALADKRPPADEALFMTALIDAHPDNADRDYAKAALTMRQITRDFPSGAFAHQAAAMASLFETMQQMLRERQSADAAARERAGAEQTAHDARRYLSRNQFDAAAREYQLLLKAPLRTQEHDEALLMLGIIQAHPDNQKKDYPKALEYLNRLLREHPDSMFAGQARAWIGTIRAIEALKAIDTRYGERRRNVR